MTSQFDRMPDRQKSESIKWKHYPPDVLPMWVADMDFYSPPAVIDALEARVNHGVFGYAVVPPELKEVIVERLDQRYRWKIIPDDIVFLPGVIAGFNLSARALSEPGGAVLIQTPVYMPFLDVGENAGMMQEEMLLYPDSEGRYEIDLDEFSAKVDDHTRMFLLCNPHNPVGRVFMPEELSRMAEICLRNRAVICSDEIHCDLIFSGHRHTPIASLDPEIAKITITLMAPSKTFNIPGLKCSFAVITNPSLRERLQQARRGLVGDVNLLGYHAALAAYRYGDAWLNELLVYLEENRNFLLDAIRRDFHGMKMFNPEGTYLAWLDCREAGVGENPYQFFLENARVGLNDGASFGRGGEGFVRLNFACPRALLEQGLARMRSAIEQLHKS